MKNILKHKNQKVLIFIILNIIILICIVFYNKYYPISIITIFKEVFVLELSVITMILAYLLFDQFGINKKLTEKRVELIIDLLTEFKKQKGFGTHSLINDDYKSNPSFYFENNMVDKQNNLYSINEFPKRLLNTPIVINLVDFDKGFEQVRKILNNPIMPKDIVDKANFLRISGGIGGTKLDDYNELLYLYFTDDGKQKLINNNTKLWMFKDNNKSTLIEFLGRFDDLFCACKNWADKHSNLNEELNLESF